MIRCVLDTKHLGLNLEQARDASKPCKIVCFRDNDNVGDPISRRSVCGFMHYALVVLVSW